MHSNFPFDRVHDWIGDADRYFLDWIMPAPIVTVSERARQNLPYDLNVAGVVHLGVPMRQYRYVETEQGDYFAWLGRFAAPKGPHLAIEAARRAGVKLVLAGIVEHANRESEEYFAREIAPHLDGDRVTYIGPGRSGAEDRAAAARAGIAQSDHLGGAGRDRCAGIDGAGLPGDLLRAGRGAGTDPARTNRLRGGYRR